jgi:hypothetical protein
VGIVLGASPSVAVSFEDGASVEPVITPDYWDGTLKCGSCRVTTESVENELVGQGTLLGMGAVLFATVVAGTIVHELSHAAALRAFSVPHEVEWLPLWADVGTLRASITGDWARVVPYDLPPDLSPWALRVAALMPLLLATPLALVPVGVLTDPFGSDNPYLIAATLGWTACALPSPRDFSLVWYAEQVVALERPVDGS